MKAKIVGRAELKKSPMEHQAEALLRRLRADNAVEIHLEGISARTIRRAFSKAATNLGLSIEVRTRDDRVYVLLKQERDTLKEAIRDALDKQASKLVTEAELAHLTRLNGSRRDITDLSGIEYCTKLTELYLWKNEISDISPLASLTKLTKLYLRGNHISDISPLTSLNNLTELSLWENGLSDISPLTSLTKLTKLYLRANQISDISALASLTDLIDLYLVGNPLNEHSVNIIIPQLEERGVEVVR